MVKITTTAFPAEQHAGDRPEPKMRLIIVRHGETDWTLAGRYTGATDVSLTATGRREATSLAPARVGLSVQAAGSRVTL